MISDTTIARQQYTLSTGTDALSFDFYVLDEAHLSVWNTPADGSAPSLLVLDTDYSVSGTGDEEGNVTVTMIGQAASDVITVLREPTLNQLLDLVFKGRIYEGSLEDGLDKLTMICLMLKEQINRCLKYAPTETTGWIAELDAAADRINKIFSFGASGEIELIDVIGEWKGDWAAATNYVKYDLFKDATNAATMNNIYVVLVDHTSTTVAADLASNRIALLLDAKAAADSATAAAASAAAAAASSSLIDSVANNLKYKGNHDASGNTAPVGATLGQFWTISVAGTFGGISFAIGEMALYDGTNWHKQDFVNGLDKSVVSIAALTAFDATLFADNTTIEVLGYYTSGDGGGGMFWWDSTSTDTADGGAIFEPDAGGVGRWKRLFPSSVNDIRWWGAKQDAELVFDPSGNVTGTDASPALQAAVDYLESTGIDGPKRIFIPSDVVFRDTVLLKDHYLFEGAGVELEPDKPLCWFWPDTPRPFITVADILDRSYQYLSLGFQNFTCRSYASKNNGETPTQIKTGNVFCQTGRCRLYASNFGVNYFDIGFYMNEAIATTFTSGSLSRNIVSLLFSNNEISGSTSVSTTVSVRDIAFNGNALQAIRIEDASLNYLSIGGFTYFEKGNESQNYNKYDLADDGACSIWCQSTCQVNILEAYTEAQSDSAFLYFDDKQAASANESRSMLNVANLKFFGDGSLTSAPVIVVNTVAVFNFGGGSVLRANGSLVLMGKDCQNAMVSNPRTNYSLSGGGARSNDTAYVLGNIIEVGSFSWRCIQAGTSASSEPAGYTAAASLTDPTQLIQDDGTARFQVCADVVHHDELYKSAAPVLYLSTGSRSVSGSTRGSLGAPSSSIRTQRAVFTSNDNNNASEFIGGPNGITVGTDGTRNMLLGRDGKFICGGNETDRDEDYQALVQTDLTGVGTIGHLVRAVPGSLANPDYLYQGQDQAGLLSFGVRANGEILGYGDIRRITHNHTTGRLRLGSYYLWVDSTGVLRIKNSNPTSDTDGTVVGTQT